MATSARTRGRSLARYAQMHSLRRQGKTGQLSSPAQSGESVERLLYENERDVKFLLFLKPRPYFKYISPSVEAMCGFPPEAFYADALLPLKLLRDESGKPFRETEFFLQKYTKARFRHLNGRSGWAELMVTHVLQEGTQLVGLEGIVRDLTAQRQISEDLRSARDRLDALFQAAPQAIIELNVHDRVMHWNLAAERIFGWSAEEALGQTYPLVPKEKLAEYEDLKAQVYAGKMLRNIETTRMCKDGFAGGCFDFCFSIV